MKNRIFSPQLLRRVLLLGSSLLFFSACTSTDVQRAIVDTNAAMIAPYQLQEAGQDGSGAWKAPAAQLNALIAANSEEKILVASLQLRKAILYTTYKKFPFAKNAWDGVTKAGGESSLGNSRDKSLYALRNEITWAFQDCPPFDQNIAMSRQSGIPSLGGRSVQNVLDQYQTQIDGAIASNQWDLRVYLATLKVQIELKSNGRATKDSTPKERAIGLSNDLERYLSHFEAVDFDWLLSGADLQKVEPGKKRYRSHLRLMWNLFRKRIAGAGPFSLVAGETVSGSSQVTVSLKRGATALRSFQIPVTP